MRHHSQHTVLENMIVLRNCPIFDSLTPKELERIALVVEEIVVQPGEMVIAYEDVHAHFYVVKNGSIEVRQPTEEQKDISVRVLTRSDHIGGTTVFLDYYHYPYEVVSLEKTLLLSLNREDLYDTLINNPRSALKIIEYFALRLVDSGTEHASDRKRSNAEKTEK